MECPQVKLSLLAPLSPYLWAWHHLQCFNSDRNISELSSDWGKVCILLKCVSLRFTSSMISRIIVDGVRMSAFLAIVFACLVISWILRHWNATDILCSITSVRVLFLKICNVRYFTSFETPQPSSAKCTIIAGLIKVQLPYMLQLLRGELPMESLICQRSLRPFVTKGPNNTTITEFNHYFSCLVNVCLLICTMTVPAI